MTENTNLQIQVLRDLLTAVESASIPIWFYGGYALDALEGRPLRAHKDIDIIVALEDQYRLRAELSAVGFEIVEQGMHYTVFVKSDQYVEVLTFKRLADGTFVTDTGETGVYPWPDNTFPSKPNGRLLGKSVRAISYEGLYIFKAGFSSYDAQQPLREKDKEDLKLICSSISSERQIELASFFDPLPGTRKYCPNQTQLSPEKSGKGIT